MANTATVSGQLIDTDAVAWGYAEWIAEVVSPSSPPIYKDGTAIAAARGVLDSTGNFTGTIPRTDMVYPAGCTLRFTIYSATSAPPATKNGILVTAPAVSLGAILSPLPGLRIQSGPMVYAYTDFEVINAVHGDGYCNTLSQDTFVLVGSAWLPINAAPVGGAVAYTDRPNIFATGQTINGTLSLNGALDSTALNVVSSSAPVATTKAQIRTAPPDVLVTPPGAAGGVYLAFDKGTSGTWFGNGAGASSAHITAAGDAIFNGNQTTKGYAQIGTGDLVTIGKYSSTATKPAIGATAGYLIIDTAPGAAVQFNNTSGAEVQFCGGDATGQPVARITGQGNGIFNGSLLAKTGMASQGSAPITPGSTAMLWVANNGYIDAVGKDTATTSTLNLRTYASDGSQLKTMLVLEGSSGNSWFNGPLTVPGAADGVTRAFSMTSPTHGDLAFVPGAVVGAYNPMVGAGDHLLMFYGAGGQGTGALVIGPYSASTTGIRIDAAANTVQIAGSVSTYGPLNANGITIWGNQTAALNYPNMRSSGDGHVYLSPSPGKNLYLMPDGGNSLVFGNGAGGAAGSMDTAGNMNVNGNFFAAGTLSAGTKTFKIPHPVDATKSLVHGCLEGPEYGVYYRGEGVTANGRATVELPDYFEALTHPEGRTVQLTIKVEDGDGPTWNGIAAGPVKDGKFTVYSESKTESFYWQVSAARADVAPLEIEPNRLLKPAAEESRKKPPAVAS